MTSPAKIPHVYLYGNVTELASDILVNRNWDSGKPEIKRIWDRSKTGHNVLTGIFTGKDEYLLNNIFL